MMWCYNDDDVYVFAYPEYFIKVNVFLPCLGTVFRTAYILQPFWRLCLLPSWWP